MDNKKIYTKYLFYVLSALTLTTIGSGLSLCFLDKIINLNTGLIIFGSIIPMVAFMFTKGTIKKVMYYVFSFIEGLLIGPLITLVTYNYSISQILFISIISVLALTLIFGFVGYMYKGEMRMLGKILFVCLLLIVLYNILSIFFNLPSAAILGVILFSLYIMYDINKFKNIVDSGVLYELADEKETTVDDFIILSAMNMYLNILNLFLYLLELFGND